MKLLNPDANIETASSPASAQGADTLSDAMQKSSSATDGAPQTDQQLSLADVIAGLKEKYTAKSDASESPTEGTEASNGAVPKENATEKEQKNLSDGKTEEPATTQPTDDSKLPFHAHPRFKQLTEERTRFETELKELRPKVAQLETDAKQTQELRSYLQQNQISGKDFTETMQLTALVKTNPQEALKQLEQVVEALRITTGAALPKDLQAEVDNGQISLTNAQQLAKAQMEARRLQYQQEQMRQSSQQQEQAALIQSLDAWSASKAQTDPSFKIKPNGGPDGKFELVTQKFLNLWSQKPPTNQREAIALAEQAYTEVTNALGAMIPRKEVRRPLAPRSSPQQQKTVDISKSGWAREIGREVANRHS